MAQEGNIPLGDIGRAKVASPMEHGALEEVLPVGSDVKYDTSHFQFTFF